MNTCYNSLVSWIKFRVFYDYFGGGWSYSIISVFARFIITMFPRDILRRFGLLESLICTSIIFFSVMLVYISL